MQSLTGLSGLSAVAKVETVNGLLLEDGSSYLLLEDAAYLLTDVELGPNDVSITTTTLPDGLIDDPYSETIVATGGTEPYTFAVTAGSLPAGLTLNTTTGVISGTPTTIESQDFTITVTDSGGGNGPYTDEQDYTVEIPSNLAGDFLMTSDVGKFTWDANRPLPRYYSTHWNGDSVGATSKASSQDKTGLPLGAAQRTISVWLRPNGAGFGQEAFSYGDNVAGSRVGVWYDRVSPNFGLEMAGCGVFVNGNIDNVWTHLGLVFPSGGTIVSHWLIYVNGVLTAPGTTSNGNTSVNTTISGSPPSPYSQLTNYPVLGGLNQSTGLLWNGKIYDLRVFDVAKTAGEISSIYAGNIDETGLVLRYDFHEGTGTTISSVLR